MGRYYQTAKPNFVQGNIYTPPVELMQNLLAVNEKRTDDLISKSELLEGTVDTINHLNFDEENKRVKNIQSKYKTAIDDITQKIYDNPLEYKKHLPSLKQLQKEIINDKTSGEWYNIERRQSDYAAWLKDNQKLKESNPTLFNQLNNHWYNDIVNRASENSFARFSGQKIIDKPDLIEGYRQHFENIKANASETSDGKYKINNKWVTEDEVANIAWNTLASDKNFKGYVNQMGNILGDKSYLTNPFNLVYNDKIISFDDYDKLDSEEKKKVKRQLNQENAFYSDLASVAQTYGFTDTSVEADKYGLQRNKALLDSKLITQRGQVGQELELLRQKGDINKMLLKYELEGEKNKEKYKNDLLLKSANGDKGAENILNRITAKETLGTLGNPNANIEQDYLLINNNREKADIPNDGKTYAYALPGTTEYAAQQRRKNSTEFAINALKDNTIKLNNGKEFKAKDYFDWLGNRKHTEDTAKEFLQREKNIYQLPSFDTSIAQETINNTRWTPSWMKDDAARDWDKIYTLGNKYEEKRNEWYENYSKSSQQLSFQPITNLEIGNNIISEIKNNKENFYVTDINGDTPKKFRDILDNININSSLSVTAANAHNEMGIKVKLDDKEYFIFPNNGNNATSNLITNLSMMGVDNKSQYFKEMSDRVSSNLLHNINKSGKNSKGTKSIVTKINGIEVSLELIGDEVHLRQPDQGLNTKAIRTFKNMQEFTKAFYSSQNK